MYLMAIGPSVDFMVFELILSDFLERFVVWALFLWCILHVCFVIVEDIIVESLPCSIAAV